MDDDYESVLLVVREVYCYKIPPLSSSRGYRAQDWNVENPLWKGRLRVIAKGPNVVIQLEDGQTGELFAACPYEENRGCVEPVIDSSRYFVLKIEDQGRHAFIGVGFLDRSHAFDFNVTLQDHFRHLAAEKKAEEQRKSGPQPPAMDFSLKEGQTLNLHIAGGSANPRRNRPPRPAAQEGGMEMSVLIPLGEKI
ncbi:Adaptin ear-binding coat-associated protein 2 [Actinomortierella ambigua]|nr:Adaptin ear-binding coat-associated protein 2 [Actinomortierella ambigua]